MRTPLSLLCHWHVITLIILFIVVDCAVKSIKRGESTTVRLAVCSLPGTLLISLLSTFNVTRY